MQVEAEEFPLMTQLKVVLVAQVVVAQVAVLELLV